MEPVADGDCDGGRQGFGLRERGMATMRVSVAMVHGMGRWREIGNGTWDGKWMAEAQHNTTMKGRDILGVSSVKPAKASSTACLSTCTKVDKEGSKEGCKEDATKQPILPTTNTQQLEQHQQPPASLISSRARTTERPPPGQASGGSTRPWPRRSWMTGGIRHGRGMAAAWSRISKFSLRVSASLCLVHCRQCSRPHAPCCLPCALRPSSFSGRLCMI